jgi:hypothetical protein
MAGDLGSIFGGVNSLIGGIGGAISSEFAAQGDIAQANADDQAAKDFGQAATIAENNAQLETDAWSMKMYQTERKINQAIGTEKAVEGFANVAGGSAGDILRDTLHQGAFAKMAITMQSMTNFNAYQEQALAFQADAAQAQGAASAARSAASGAKIAGGLDLIKGAIGLIGGFL